MYKTNHICGIYLITNKSNGKMYVGQSEDVERRIKYHKLHLSQNKHHNIYLQRAFNKYVPDCFDFKILEECECDKLNELEIDWIKKLGTFGGGYNLTVGGEGATGHVFTDEQRRRMSAAHADVRGEKNPMYGKKMIDVMGEEAFLAYKERTYEKRAETARKNAKNRIYTDEQRKRMSDAAKLRIEKYGHPNKGNKWTKEQRKAHSQVMKGMLTGGKNPNSRRVVLLNTGEEFRTIKDAAKKYGANQFSISACCAGSHRSAGVMDGVRLVWVYKEKFEKMNPKDIEMAIKEAQSPTSGPKNCNATMVTCLNTGEVFGCIMDACRKYKLDASAVVKCCKNKTKSSGKDPVTGEKLRWAYVV